MSKSPKVVLITGAARRLGAEIANRLHKAGFNIALHFHRSNEEANRLCALFNEKREHSAVTLKADLSDTKQLNHLVKRTVDEWGHLDVLINNASRFYKTALGHVTEDVWDELLTSNLKAPFFLCQAAYPYLEDRKGCVVNLGDVHGERPMRDYGIYCISKAGLIMMTKTLAKEWGPTIRVNAVSPGTVMLPEGENTLTSTQKEKIIDRIALRRHGTPEDVAKAVFYLVVDADYVTGSVLTVDGGRSLII